MPERDNDSLSAAPMDARAEPVLDSPESEAFYADAIRELLRVRIPFLVAGTFAVSAYTGISRATKDLDIFCKAGERRCGNVSAAG